MENQSANEKVKAERDAAIAPDMAHVDRRLRMTREEARDGSRVRSSERTPGPSLLRQSNLAD